MQADTRVAHELRAFGAAVERRFGDGGIHQMLRAGGRTNAVTAPSVAPADQRVLDQVAGLTATLKAGKRAGLAVAQRQGRGRAPRAAAGMWV